MSPLGDRPPIRFLNHASFLVNTSQSTLVCDPWLSGSAFNNGWDLVWPVAPPADIDRITHIWYSHEHPDHFSIAFLHSIPKERRAHITILFQRTRDKRVLAFCRKLGFQAVELRPGKPFCIDDEMEILCEAVPIYDSWCRITVNGLRIFNLNDCALEGRQLHRVRRLAGDCDVLFTQFSYAAWIGSPEDSSPRRAESSHLLNRLVEQCQVLRPKFVVPFASFIFFSHLENRWMNDGANNPEGTVRFIERHSESTPVLLTPDEAWDGRSSKDNAPAITQWMERYRAIAVQHQPKSIPAERLEASAHDLLARVSAKNYRFVILLLERIGLMQPIRFNVTDLDRVFCFSWRRGLEEVRSESGAADLTLGSENLDFLLRNDFGADTLCVSARFLADEAGRNKLLRTFSIPILNNSGRFVRLDGIRELASPSFLALGLRAWRTLRCADLWKNGPMVKKPDGSAVG